MPFTDDVFIRGIQEFGTWTATAGGGPTNIQQVGIAYTTTSLGRTTEEGGVIRPTVANVELRGGQSPSVIDSFLSEFGGQLQIGLLAGHATNLRIMWGLPASALTGDLMAGTPTAEVLVVRGTEIGQTEYQFYLRSMGPVAPRTYYMPRAKVADLAEVQHSRTAYFTPGATFNLYENSADQLFWLRDPPA